MEQKELFDLLNKHHLTLSSMESLTGGLFASTFASIPGASAVFKGAVVAYNNSIKEQFGVKGQTLDVNGAISAQCAKEMAARASILFDSDVAISFTGNAGPSESEEKPVGLVFVGVKVGTRLYTYELHLHGERNDIRRLCVSFGFKTIYEKVTEQYENISDNVAQESSLEDNTL